MEKNFSMLVIGPKKSGKTNMLKLIARLMAARGADVYIYGDAAWVKLAGEIGAKLYTKEEELSDFIDFFLAEYPGKRKRLRDAAMAQGRAQARKQALQFKPCVLIIDNADRIASGFNAPIYTKSADQLVLDYENGLKLAEEGKGPAPVKPSDAVYALQKHPLRHNIPTKNFVTDIFTQMSTIAELYNIFTFMSLTANNSQYGREQPLKALIEQGRGIELGGRLNDYDPLNIGSSMPSMTRGKPLPAGTGFLTTDQGVVSIRVPLVEDDEE